MVNSKIESAIKQLNLNPKYSAYMAVANAVDELKPEEFDLPQLRIAILRNFTLDPLLPVLKGEIVRSGFQPIIYQGDFDVITSEVLNPSSQLYSFEPDFIILAQWLKTLSLNLVSRFISLSKEEIESEIENVIKSIELILGGLRKKTNVPIIVNNFPLPAYSTLGILDSQLENSQSQTILKLNQKLIALAHQWTDIFIVDYFRIMARIGSLNGVDERYWHIGRSPLGRHALVPLGLEYGKFIRALRGKTSKCLALDCDNTLWGGVIGEDGISGIKLGTTYPGSCYQDFQREILNLSNRGVILTLCSKNNEEDALEVFRKHPESLLHEEHFSTWRINWDDKVTNLKWLAEELNIGLDSFVFVDDSEFECNLVREMLPQVTVVQLPEDPSAYTNTLLSGGYFDSLNYSVEDRERNQMYRADAQRKKLSEEATSVEDYLSSLQLEAEIGKPSAISIARVAQLTQKTNQFNLTTHRYSEGEIQGFVENKDSDVFAMRLRDRISDLGLIGVAIIKYENETLLIDSFMLSCRAIGRGAEDALLASIINEAQSRGIKKIQAQFIPTKKNVIAAKFYKDHGFDLIDEDDKKQNYELIINNHEFHYPDWIVVHPSTQGV